MSRPTIEAVEDNVISWKEAMYQLHREIDKLDQENDIMRQQLGIPDSVLDPNSLETIEIEVRRSNDRLGR
jgi:hypothetical protein